MASLLDGPMKHLHQYTKDFEFNDMPFHTKQSVVISLSVYVTLLFLARRLVAWRGKPFDKELKGYVLVHNAGLSLLSLVLLVGVLYELWGYWQLHSQKGIRYALWTLYCDPAPHKSRDPPILFWYYLNYLTKYVELIDTMLLALRGKPLPFLHVYHHAATLVLCWTQLVAKSTMQWVPIVLNLMVHVPMYFYYALATLGIHVWWKKYLTTCQIIQFCIDVPACVVATVFKLNWSNKWGWLGGINTDCGCDNMGAAYFGCGLLFTYLLLFVQFFIDTYRHGIRRKTLGLSPKKAPRAKKAD